MRWVTRRIRERDTGAHHTPYSSTQQIRLGTKETNPSSSVVPFDSREYRGNNRRYEQSTDKGVCEAWNEVAAGQDQFRHQNQEACQYTASPEPKNPLRGCDLVREMDEPLLDHGAEREAEKISSNLPRICIAHEPECNCSHHWNQCAESE